MAEDVASENHGGRSIRGAVVAGSFCVISLVILLVARFAFDPQSRWLDYARAYQCASGAALAGSGLWFVFALLKARTDFFDVDRKIGAAEFNKAVALVVLATVVVLVLALSSLPGMAPSGQVQVAAAERARLIRIDKHLKIFVSIVVLLAGAVVMSLPLSRLLRK